MKLLTTRIMLGAVLACALLLIQAVVAPEALGLVLLLFSAAVAVVCAVASVAILRRHKTLLAAGLLSVLATTFTMAFVRVWGLGSGEGYDVLHRDGPGAGSDLFLFLGLAFAVPAALLLLLGSVWPVRGPAPRKPLRRGTRAQSGAGALRRAAPRRPSASRPARPARPRTSRSPAR